MKCVNCGTEIVDKAPGLIHVNPIDLDQPYYCYPDIPGDYLTAEYDESEDLWP